MADIQSGKLVVVAVQIPQVFILADIQSSQIIIFAVQSIQIRKIRNTGQVPNAFVGDIYTRNRLDFITIEIAILVCINVIGNIRTEVFIREVIFIDFYIAA